MIRLIFAVVLTIGALLGLSLRVARDRDTLSTSVEALSAEVRTLDLGEAVSAVLAPGASTPGERPETPEGTRVAGDAPGVGAAVDAPPPFLPSDDTGPVVEEVVPGRGPFLEERVPEDEGSGTGGNRETAPEERRAPTMVASAVDQDAWAHLIRRMLSVYRKTDAPR